MDLHVHIPGRAPEHVVRVIDGRAVIVPPARAQTPVPAQVEQTSVQTSISNLTQ